MQQEHLAALKQFCYYVKANSRTAGTDDERVAYVLPKITDTAFANQTTKSGVIGNRQSFEQDMKRCKRFNGAAHVEDGYNLWKQHRKGTMH